MRFSGKGCVMVQGTISGRGQVVIPVEIREKLKIRPGTSQNALHKPYVFVREPFAAASRAFSTTLAARRSRASALS